MQIIKNSFVDRDAAYHASGGIIYDTQRITKNHSMEYWQQGNCETFLGKKFGSVENIKIIDQALYVGRIPTHFGHLIMEGLARLCDAPSIRIPIIGYVTDGFLPEGIFPTPKKDVDWLISTITDQIFYQIEEGETYNVKNLYVPTLPYFLSQHCAEPWRMSDLIKKVVDQAQSLHGNNLEVDDLYLIANNQNVDTKYLNCKFSDPTSELSKQIAIASQAKKLYGNTGSNTHISIFAKKNCLTEWKQRGDFDQADRNQLICDLVKTYNLF